jgi:nanoRNase/pAp phosphatase (c-di-AMP/oligoRNAs hydrolase)
MNTSHEPFTEELLRLHEWLSRATANGPVAVVTGKNGDMDTIGSAIALAASHPNMLAAGLHIGRVAQRMIERHKAPYRLLKSTQTGWPKHLAGVVVVDAAAPDQTGLTLPNVPLCIIDHHATDGWSLGVDDLRLKWDVRSTTEVVGRYLQAHAPEALSPPVCEFLLAGLVTDTGRFRHANASSFSTASMLIERGGLDYQHFIQEMEDTTLTPSDRGAVLRGLQRADTTQAGPWTVLRTSAGTLEGKVASMLSGLGADAVVVTRHRDGRTRLTVRAPRTSVLAGLHMGEIMNVMAQSIGGEGGGHDGAAGWTGDVDPIEAETAFIDAVARAPRREVGR